MKFSVFVTALGLIVLSLPLGNAYAATSSMDNARLSQTTATTNEDAPQIVDELSNAEDLDTKGAVSELFRLIPGANPDTEDDIGSISQSKPSSPAQGSGVSTGAEEVGFNPQPEPPAAEAMVIIGNEVRKEAKELDKSSPRLAKALSVSDVDTNDDLQAYAENVALGDDNISAIKMSGKAAAVSYKMPGKLFGFIPVTYTHTLRADGNRVTSHRSWWMALGSSVVDSSQMADDAETGLSTESISLAIQDAQQNLAQIISTLSAILKSNHDAAMNAIQNIR